MSPSPYLWIVRRAGLSKHLWPRGGRRSLRAAWDRQEQKPVATNWQQMCGSYIWYLATWFIHSIPGNKWVVCFEFISGYRRCWKSGCADGKGNSSLRTRNNQRCLGREIYIPYGYQPWRLVGREICHKKPFIRISGWTVSTKRSEKMGTKTADRIFLATDAFAGLSSF